MSAIMQDAGGRGAEIEPGFGAWNPGLQSRIPGELRHLCTIFRPEHAFTSAAEAAELADLTGLEASELVAFRPRRLALHEVLIRVTANLSVPDGSKIEDLGINFRRMTQTLLTACIEPQMPAIDAAYDTLRRALTARIERVLDTMTLGVDTAPGARLRLGRNDAACGDSSTAGNGTGAWPTATRGPRRDAPLAHDPADPVHAAAERAVSKVVSALLVRHGRVWGSRDMIAAVATNLACNDAGSDAIGRLIDPWLTAAAEREGYRLLPRQDAPVVMNTKGPSASGKSTLRPLQRRLAADIGVEWSEFALISPDIWRKQLIDYETLGPIYKYGAMFTGEELHIVDQKLDRYMARKAERGDMPHLLIDRFRFDSFAPDSNEAGSNLLTRFGQIVYLFFMITPPASLVERAWQRGLEVGRYKAVDDTLAHSVEAYSGMPELFFTWIDRADKRVHFEFLDNSVRLGERPRTVAFGWNDTMNVLDVGCMLDVERYRRVNVDATSPALLYPDREALGPARNTGFLKQCIEHFDAVNFAMQETGRIYLRIAKGVPAFVDPAALREAQEDADVRAGLAAVMPGLSARSPAAHSKAPWLRDVKGSSTPTRSGGGVVREQRHDPLPAERRARRRRRRVAADDAARVPARRAAPHRHEGRLRGRRLRRLHRGARRAAATARSRVEADQRLHPARCRRSTARPCSPSRALQRAGRHAASGAAGARRLPRLAVRLLHARLRDEPVRPVQERRRARRARAIDDALSGNLCRCTGYRPIVDAAQPMYALPARRRTGARRASPRTAAAS